MKRVLITGMSGTGKSTLVGELAARDWLWHEQRIQQLLDMEDVDLLFLSGSTGSPMRSESAPLR